MILTCGSRTSRRPVPPASGCFAPNCSSSCRRLSPELPSDFSYYRAVLDAAGDKPVTFRTLNIRGERCCPTGANAPSAKRPLLNTAHVSRSLYWSLNCRLDGQPLIIDFGERTRDWNHVMQVWLPYIFGEASCGTSAFAYLALAHNRFANGLRRWASPSICFLSIFCAVWMSGFLFAVCAMARSGPSSAEKMWKARMNSCIKILQQKDKAIRNNWQGHCREEEATSVSAAAAIRLRDIFADRSSFVVDDGGVCRNEGAPIATKCGLASPILDMDLLGEAAVRVRLPGGRCASFIPVLLTNKEKFACNAIRGRIACTDVSYDDRTERTTITLSTRPSGNSEKTTINFGMAELDEHEGRIGELINHPQFTIIPERSGGKSIAKEIIDVTRAQEEACVKTGQHSPATCHRQATIYADAKLQEVVRRYRNPRHDNTQDRISQDAIRVVDFLRSKEINATDARLAAKLAFPDGSITASALRRESLRGRLVIERIAGKDYTTLANIERMRRLCQLERKESGSGSAPGEVTAAAAFAKPPGSFSTATSISPRDALRAKLQQQKANSRNTSRQSTARRARHGT